MIHHHHLLLPFLLLLLLLPPSSSPFNVDVASPLHVLGPPSSRSPDSPDYFGYSLALEEGSLYVGAPGHAGSGAVFHCPFDLRSSSSRTFQCNKIDNIGDDSFFFSRMFVAHAQRNIWNL